MLARLRWAEFQADLCLQLIRETAFRFKGGRNPCADPGPAGASLWSGNHLIWIRAVRCKCSEHPIDGGPFEVMCRRIRLMY